MTRLPRPVVRRRLVVLGLITAGLGLVGPMSMAQASGAVDYLNATVVETHVLDWGHRPAWSPDGTTLAFLGLQHHFGAGYAYELDLTTGEVRCLTCHLENGSVLRVYYLPDGSFLFQAPATPLYAASPADTSIPEHFNCAIAGREHQLGVGTDDVSGLFRCELYWLPASLEGPLRPLGVHSFEEVAIDLSTSRISWVVPAGAVTPDWQIWLGDLVHDGKHAQLINREQVLTTFPESVADPPVMAWVEVMDFFVGREAILLYARLVGTENQGDGEVLELDLATGALMNHSNNPAHDEAHLFFPDDTFALNERDGGLWALQLGRHGPAHPSLRRRHRRRLLARRPSRRVCEGDRRSGRPLGGNIRRRPIGPRRRQPTQRRCRRAHRHLAPVNRFRGTRRRARNAGVDPRLAAGSAPCALGSVWILLGHATNHVNARPDRCRLRAEPRRVTTNWRRGLGVADRAGTGGASAGPAGRLHDRARPGSGPVTPRPRQGS